MTYTDRLKTSAMWLLNVLFPAGEIEEEVRKMDVETISRKVSVRNIDEVIYFLNYRDQVVRKMIWMLKYRGDSHVSKLLGSVLNDYLLEELSDIEIFDKSDVVLVPIPIHPARRRSRGFNQIELVLKNLKNDYEIDTKSLIKNKNNRPQTEIKKKVERIQNVVDAFTVSSPESVKNKHIILIDDVTTTGSTLREAKKTLVASGAKSVVCIAFAH